MFLPAPPVSKQFDDVYFSAAGGLAEVHHVFHQGNYLPSRFLEAQQNGQTFTIGELGFGTGLACGATMLLWDGMLNRGCKVTNNASNLVYVSLERYPLNWPEIEQALKPWPQVLQKLQPWATSYQQAIETYKSKQKSAWLTLTTTGISLQLGLGDVSELLPQYPSNINAWFLDGFTPAKNPAMWQADILRLIGEKTAPAGTLATFTAASQVRRDLINAGFSMQKVKGFSHKREMLIGNKLND